MTTKRKVLLFQERDPWDVRCDMHNWLTHNQHCKITNITNVNGAKCPSILAVVECSKVPPDVNVVAPLEREQI